MVEKYGQIGVCQRKGRKNLVLKYRDGERAPFEVVCKEGSGNGNCQILI